MTDLLTRAPVSAPSARPRSVVLAAMEAAAMAAGLGLVAVGLAVVLTWAADARSGAGAVATLRSAGQIWLLAQHASLRLPAGHFGLVPLGLSALPALLLVRAGATVAHATSVGALRTAATATLALAGSYGVLVALVTGLTATATAHPAPLQALAGGFVLAAVAGGVGVVRGAGLWVPLGQLVPGRVRPALRAGAAATAVLLGAGALLAGASLAMHAGRASELASALSPGIVGGLALLLVCVAYLPTAVAWGAAYVVGPGFAVGVGTAVAPAGVTLGALPAFPLLAALPGGGSAPVAALPLLVAPVLAGAVAGWLISRAAVEPEVGFGRVTLRGLAAGPVTGVAMAVLSWLASGPAGPGRLATVGPSAWQVGLASAGEVGLFGAAVAGGLVWWRGRSATGLSP